MYLFMCVSRLFPSKNGLCRCSHEKDKGSHYILYSRNVAFGHLKKKLSEIVDKHKPILNCTPFRIIKGSIGVELKSPTWIIYTQLGSMLSRNGQRMLQMHTHKGRFLQPHIFSGNFNIPKSPCFWLLNSCEICEYSRKPSLFSRQTNDQMQEPSSFFFGVPTKTGGVYTLEI